MNTIAAAPRWWVPGDWNGFFGLFTNVVLNVIVLTTLCLHVVNLPADIVYGRILPALGIALPLGNLYYAYLAWRLAKSEGRGDVTAMPYGPSVPHMFIVVFLIMLPIYLKTKDTPCWPGSPASSGASLSVLSCCSAPSSDLRCGNIRRALPCSAPSPGFR